MVKRHHRSSDGLYHIHGRRYKHLRGSRVQVWNQNAYETEGGLKKHQLLRNRHGRIVSRKKHRTAKRERGSRFRKAGYDLQKRGQGFGPRKLTGGRSRSRSRRSRRRTRRRSRRHRR